MLHPTQAVTLSREDFKAEAELIDNIYKIKNFCIKAFTRYEKCIQTNLKMLNAGGLMK